MNTNDINNLCMGCMSQKNNEGQCAICGFDESTHTPAPHHLPLRTILGGKYLVGRVLGEGGFGITYLGWDLNLDLKIAIKEYYPTGFVTRENTTTNTVTPYVGEKEEFFTKGRARFVDEAKSLAKFYALPGIVSVKDFFLENGTAYIVMEFVEGVTLKQMLAQTGGKLPADQVFEMMRPLMNSLAEIHRAGIIHRDISPDNIMVTKQGNVKLLDFGAARDYMDSGNKSMSVLLKPGYAPEEQYRSRGVQGPWTDVYALCATMYKAITGVTPLESVERLRSDSIKRPSELGIAIKPQQEDVLMKGMAVLQENRFQSIADLFDSAYRAELPKEQKLESIAEEGRTEAVTQEKNENKRDNKKTVTQRFAGLPKARKILAISAAIVVVLAVAGGALAAFGKGTSLPTDEYGMASVDVTMETVPSDSEISIAPTATMEPMLTSVPTGTPEPALKATPVPTDITSSTPVPADEPNKTEKPKSTVAPAPAPTIAPAPTPAPTPNNWSDWVTELPKKVTQEKYIIESKTQYAYLQNVEWVPCYRERERKVTDWSEWLAGKATESLGGDLIQVEENCDTDGVWTHRLGYNKGAWSDIIYGDCPYLGGMEYQDNMFDAIHTWGEWQDNFTGGHEESDYITRTVYRYKLK